MERIAALKPWSFDYRGSRRAPTAGLVGIEFRAEEVVTHDALACNDFRPVLAVQGGTHRRYVDGWVIARLREVDVRDIAGR
jgi:hypothetical protein